MEVAHPALDLQFVFRHPPFCISNLDSPLTFFFTSQIWIPSRQISNLDFVPRPLPPLWISTLCWRHRRSHPPTPRRSRAARPMGEGLSARFVRNLRGVGPSTLRADFMVSTSPAHASPASSSAIYLLLKACSGGLLWDRFTECPGIGKTTSEPSRNSTMSGPEPHAPETNPIAFGWDFGVFDGGDLRAGINSCAQPGGLSQTGNGSFRGRWVRAPGVGSGFGVGRGRRIR